MEEKICLVSLGCPKNLVDSEIILGLLSKRGFIITTEPSSADIIIVNTCSFIQDAIREAIETILKLIYYKREGRCRILVVTGCLPQRYGKVLESQFPEVDLFVGTGSFYKLPELLTKKRRFKTFISETTFLYNDRTPRILSTPSFSSYLKIAEGCSRRCTFCTVPDIRGPYRSRRPRSIIREAQKLADQGVKELILIAQDTTVYGEDLKEEVDFEKLLRSLSKIDGLRWIRVLYCYPRRRYFPDSLLELFREEKKICPYIDIPIQHIDDYILRRMGRGVKSKEIRSLLEKIRNYLPEISLRSTFIVGFPGEKESHFRKLLDFVSEIEFDYLGAFKYSREEGTSASRLSDQVSEEVKEERFRILMELQKKISLKKYSKFVGRSMEVLVEGPCHEHGTLRGRLKSQAPEIDGCVFLKGEAKPGDWVEVKITQALPYDLLGTIERRI